MEQAVWVIVSNPVSGKGRALDRSKRLKNSLEKKGLVVVEVNTNSLEENFLSLTRAISTHSPNGVLIVGGDGLVNNVVNHLYNLNVEIPFAVVPEGTGNDFARTSGTYGLSDGEILNLILGQEPRAMDLLLVNGRVCVQIAATGFDAQVNRRANSLKWLRGKGKYVLAMLQEISRLKKIGYRMVLDGREQVFDAIFVALANSPSYGGGMRISPDSKPNDGIVEIAILHPVNRLELLRVFPLVFSGKHVNHKKFRRYSASTGRLEAQTSVYADGEDFGELPIDFQVLPEAIKVWWRQ